MSKPFLLSKTTPDCTTSCFHSSVWICIKWHRHRLRHAPSKTCRPWLQLHITNNINKKSNHRELSKNAKSVQRIISLSMQLLIMCFFEQGYQLSSSSQTAKGREQGFRIPGFLFGPPVTTSCWRRPSPPLRSLSHDILSQPPLATSSYDFLSRPAPFGTSSHNFFSDLLSRPLRTCLLGSPLTMLHPLATSSTALRHLIATSFQTSFATSPYLVSPDLLAQAFTRPASRPLQAFFCSFSSDLFSRLLFATRHLVHDYHQKNVYIHTDVYVPCLD